MEKWDDTVLMIYLLKDYLRLLWIHLLHCLDLFGLFVAMSWTEIYI